MAECNLDLKGSFNEPNGLSDILDAVKENDSAKVLAMLRSFQMIDTIMYNYSETSDNLLCKAIHLDDLILFKYLVLEKKLKGYWSIDIYMDAIELCATLGRADLIGIISPFLRTHISCSAVVKTKNKKNKRKYAPSHNSKKILKLQKALFIAIEKEYIDCVIEILDFIKDKDFCYEEAILLASGSTNQKVFTCVVDATKDKFKKTVEDSTLGSLCLNKASKSDCIETAKYLLDAGVKPNFDIEFYGGDYTLEFQPLMLAKSTVMAQLLIDYGANLNGQTINSEVSRGNPVSVLYVACLQQKYDLVEYFIKQGGLVDIDLVNAIFNDPRMGKEIGLKVVQHLSDPNQLDNNQQCPLQLAVSREDFPAVKMLVEKGADINIKLDVPVICLAVSSNNEDILRFLLDHGADLTSLDNKQKATPIFWAVKAYGTDSTATRLLIEKGADFNSVCSEGCTPLWYAHKYRHIDRFRLLLDAGADINIDCNGMTLLSTVLTEASPLRSSDFLLPLLKNGAKVSSKETYLYLHKCLHFKAFGCFSALIYYGGFCPVLLDEKSIFCKAQRSVVKLLKGIFSPLCMAIICGHVTIAREMLDAGFLTLSDLTVIHNQSDNLGEAIQEHSPDSKFEKIMTLLDEVASTPLSLKQLCLVHVSDLVGPQSERKQRVAQLGLPVPLQQCLMFSHKGIIAPKYLEAYEKNTQNLSPYDEDTGYHPDSCDFVGHGSDLEDSSEDGSDDMDGWEDCSDSNVNSSDYDYGSETDSIFYGAGLDSDDPEYQCYYKYRILGMDREDLRGNLGYDSDASD